MPQTSLEVRQIDSIEVAVVRPKPARLSFIDAVRGFVMVLMALDHVRAFFHAKAVIFDPTDLYQTTPAIFLTRWVTHLCAPVFVVLAGAGASLSLQRGRSPGDLARYLRSRGLWLVLIELTVVKLGWSFDLDYHHVVGQVIWAIGWGMILLSFLVRLKPESVMKIGVAGLVLHDLLVQIPSDAAGLASNLWAILVSGETIEWLPGYEFASKYPVLPWASMLAVGYGVGRVLTASRERRRRELSLAGVVCWAAYVPLRWVEMGGRAGWDPLWLLDAEKYPPSLTFFLMTLGMGLLLLAAFDREDGWWTGPLAVFGRVPFFFYVVHIPLIHAMAIIAEEVGQPEAAYQPLEDWRFSLPFVYVTWFSVLSLLYAPCRWFARLKRRRTDAWLNYL